MSDIKDNAEYDPYHKTTDEEQSSYEEEGSAEPVTFHSRNVNLSSSPSGLRGRLSDKNVIGMILGPTSRVGSDYFKNYIVVFGISNIIHWVTKKCNLIRILFDYFKIKH